jgi:hypothetical protein
MRYCLEAVFYDPDVDRYINGRVVSWNDAEVGGRKYIQLQGYADPIVAAQTIEGAMADDALVWVAFQIDGEFPDGPTLTDLQLVRGLTYFRGRVCEYRAPATSSDPSSVDAGPVPLDAAAATVRAFQGLDATPTGKE